MIKKNITKINLKKSFTLFEVIISLTIASIIGISSLYYLKDLVSFNKNNLEKQINNLDLKSTKMFLQKNVIDLSDLTHKNSNLFFKDSLLLKNVDKFSKNELEKYYEVNISFQNTNQTWIIKK